MSDEQQLARYAKDLAALYKLEQEKSAQLKAAQLQLQAYAKDISESFAELKSSNLALREAYIDTINRLVVASEYKDQDTGNHIERISLYSCLIGKALGLSERELDTLRYASPMHDVGKIGISDAILLKEGKLTDEEFELMKSHTLIGARILANSKSLILQEAERIALSHHERWDGSGYPHGISGEAIPLSARLVGLVDAFDALTSKRPYKEPYPCEVALQIILKQRGKQFDPRLVDLFSERKEEVFAVREANQEKAIDPDKFVWSDRDIREGVNLQIDQQSSS